MAAKKTDKSSVDEAPPTVPADIAAEWADEYPDGAELFGATFEADDFVRGSDYEDGTTVAIERCPGRPHPGWIRKHKDMNDLERTFALIEEHSCQRALDVLDSLKEKPWNDFCEAWGRDGGLIEGKSNRSARRSAR